jgi:muramidase (phage lysozyme)
MALPPGASARDRWLDLADEARAKTKEALADGNRRMAGLWDEEERRLLGLAYGDTPTPANDDNASDAADTQIASVDDDPAAMGEMILAADTPSARNRLAAAPKARKPPQRPAPKGRAAAKKPLPPEKQAENVKKAREAMSSPEFYAFMQAISAGEGDYDQLVGGKRFKGTEYQGKASGAYQITSGTRDDVLLPELGLKDFSRDTQDVMGAHLILSKPGALEDIQRGDVEEAVKKLNGTWPSLPGGKQTRIDMDQFKARYKEKLDSLMKKLGSSIVQ